MATARQFRKIALALDGTSEAAHFDRAAFKVKRIYATLAADGKSANLKFTPDEQELKCLTAPDGFERLANAWGLQEWTTVTLKAVTLDELKIALETAWRHAVPPPKKAKTSKA